jgi:hypothetical protein
MKNLLFLFLIVPQLSFAGEPTFPTANIRKAILHDLVQEMIRLDGEGFIVREGRPSKFSEIGNHLEKEAQDARNWSEFILALKKLDRAYPNLHAYFEPSDQINLDGRVVPTVGFSGEWISANQTQYRINRVDPISFPKGFEPRVGDLLIGINDRPIEEWKNEHFDFCKWTLPEQCDLEFPSDFYNETSGWTRKNPLYYTLQREGRKWTVAIPLKDRQPRVKDEARLLCANFPDRYAGFHLVYGGKFACFFEKDSDPSTVILRITSFQYKRSSNQEGPSSPREEVNSFMSYWQTHARQTKHLIIDVSNNGGGNQPTPYYEVFFDRPYQEQWVRFKKIQELNDANLRSAMFWETNAQEIWFQNVKKEGVWDATPYGEFLPPVPMFCALEDQDCRLGLFPVRNPGFSGNVSLIVNHACVSSCDALVYTFKQELQERVKVIGQPHAADTTYSRIRIGVELEDSTKGFRLKILPQYGKVPGTVIFSQVVSVTRSVKADGAVVSGKPLEIDRFVSNSLEREGFWHMDAVDLAVDLRK